MSAASPTSRVPDIPGSQAQQGPYVRARHTDRLQPPFGRRLMVSDVGDRDIPHRAPPSIAIDLTKGRGPTLLRAVRPVPVAGDDRSERPGEAAPSPPPGPRGRRSSSAPHATLMGHPASCQGTHADLEEIAP